MGLINQAWKIVKMTRRVGGVRAAKRLVRQAPKQIALFRNLLTDPRVPTAPKAVFLGALGFAVSPLNIPGWIPFLGPLDDLGIAMIAGSFFLKRVPPHILAEHRQTLGLLDDFTAA